MEEQSLCIYFENDFHLPTKLIALLQSLSHQAVRKTLKKLPNKTEKKLIPTLVILAAISTTKWKKVQSKNLGNQIM